MADRLKQIFNLCCVEASRIVGDKELAQHYANLDNMTYLFLMRRQRSRRANIPLFPSSLPPQWCPVHNSSRKLTWACSEITRSSVLLPLILWCRLFLQSSQVVGSHTHAQLMLFREHRNPSSWCRSNWFTKRRRRRRWSRKPT